MADRTHLRVADNNDIADDDPFAELTRIMGFDPRQPVRPQAPAQPKSAPADDLADDGDFDIDLEKELMGEFGADERDGDAIAERREPAFEPAASDASDDDFAVSLDQDFALDHDVAGHDVAGHDVAGHDVAGEADGIAAGSAQASAPTNDAAFDLDFDNAVASSLEDVSPFEDDLPMEDELAASLDQGFLLDDDEAGEVEPRFAAAEISAPVVEPAFDDEFDDAVASSLEDELMLDDHSSIEHDHFGFAPGHAVPVHAVSVEDEAVSDEDFTADFDDAMADVDMDFDIRADRPVEVEEPMTREALAEAVDTQDQASSLVPQNTFDNDLDMTFDDAFAEEIEEPAAPIAATVQPMVSAAVSAKPTAWVPKADDRSLEDELNALLGTMSARVAPVVAPVAKEPVMVQQPVAAAEKTAANPSRAGEMDWNLDEKAALPPAQQNPVQAADADLGSFLLDELEAQDFGAEDAAGPASADVDFDNDTFETDFARSIDLGDERADNAPAASLDSLDWLAARATPPEPARSWSRVTPVAQPQPAFAGQPMASAAPATVAVPSYQDLLVEADFAPAAQAPTQQAQPAPYDEMPDVETIDVPERVVALADDLDIPELHFDEDEPAAPAYDDFDAEFSGLLTEMNAMDAAAAPVRSAAYDDESYDAGFKPGHDRVEARTYAARPVEMPARAAAPAAYADAADGFDIGDLPGSRPVSQADDFAVDELDYDPELDEAMSVPGLAEQGAVTRSRGRGLFVAAIVGAVAVAGGLGAFALSFGGKGSNEAPVIVKADNAPIKVKPENPGGAVVPNQDNKVYDAVAKGAKPAEPVQDKLVTSTEEPVDVTAKEPPSRIVDLSPDGTDAASDADADVAATPAPKSEDRIAQVLQDVDKGANPDVVAVAPRKVRTMVVKPDGSLVAREDPAPAAPQVAAAEPVDPAPQHVAPAGQADAQETGTVPSAAEQPAKPAVALKAEAKASNTQSANTPATVPVAPQRPSDQPVDVVGEVKPDQVASIDPAATSAGGGSWSMQIASQPTVESAQSSYADLQRRYGGVLAGRTANIVKAEIAGKGTFYRVRVPAQSRNDAINLCTSYKAAGGNCFVSR